MPSMDERITQAVKDVTFIVTDAQLRPSRSDDGMYQVLYLRGDANRKKSLRGATSVIVADLDGKLVGAVARFSCPHWFQQAPAEQITPHTIYDSAEAALSALGVNVEL